MKFIYISILLFSSLCACAQKPITNGMSGLDARNAINSNFDTLYNQKEVYFNVLDYGAIGDNITDDYAAFQEAIDSALANDGVLFIPNGTYYIGSPITASNTYEKLKRLTIEGNNSVLETNISTNQRLLTIAGSGGTYDTITTGIKENRNFFVCAALAARVGPGDLIKVVSSQPFNDTIVYYNEASGRGEMKVVRNVVDSFIYVSEPFFDSYSTNPWYDGRDTALNWKTPIIRASKVYPIRLVINDLTLKNRTTDYSEYQITGFRVHFLIDSKVNINVYNFVDYGITALHCFNTHFDVNVYNTPRGSWGIEGESPGYGFNLVGTSIGCLITGNISNARHCFTYNCGSGGGVGWNNTVSINAYTGRENPMIDCHGPCGSIYVRDCHLFGGNTVDVETSLTSTDPEADIANRSKGIELGAKYSYISDCYFYNVNYIAISTREASEVHELVINRCCWRRLRLFLLIRAQNERPEAFINNIIVDGVSGDFSMAFSGNYDNIDTFYKGETVQNIKCVRQN